jgi:hypothetical protein
MDAPDFPSSFYDDRFHQNLLESDDAANENSCDGFARAESSGRSTGQGRETLRCSSSSPGSGPVFYPSDIVYFKTAESEPERTVWHPTQKPVELGRYLVRTYSNEGDVVLDNAFGSGSFLIAAALEKRRFIGIERNEEVRHRAQRHH